MTTTTTRPKAPPRVKCPRCTLRLLTAGIASYGPDAVVTAEDGPPAIADAIVRSWRVREMATPELLAELQAIGATS